MGTPLRFVVIGDTHFVRRESHDGGFTRNAYGDLHDLERYTRMHREVIPRIYKEIQNCRPEFVVHTGDAVQGNCDSEEAAMQEMEEALTSLKEAAPVLYCAVGNHDGHPHKEPVNRLMHAVNAQALNRPMEQGYYSFVTNNSLFIILDYTRFKPGDAQSDFIKQIFPEGNKYAHVFVFAHPPLIPVVRPFFSKYPFAETVLHAMNGNRVDAYFCGHTHNQIASLHRLNSQQWVPQLKSSPIGDPEVNPVNVTAVRPLLPNPDGFELCWGFLEDTAPGWWMVTVDGDQVIAEWHVLDQGACGRLEWRTGEKPTVTLTPDFPSDYVTAELPPLEEIESVRLRAAGTSCKKENGYRVRLNEQSVGALPTLGAFSCRSFLDIGKEHWHLLKSVNQLTVTTADETMCIGGFVLEIRTRRGWVSSSVSDFYANTEQWDVWKAKPLKHIAPEEEIYCELSFS